METTEVKMKVFEAIGHEGLDTMKLYVDFITDAPKEEWGRRMKVALQHPGRLPLEELEGIISFLGTERNERQDPEREGWIEEFRKMFREAYPDAAKFIETIHVIPRKPEFYFDNGGIACDGFLSVKGIKTNGFSAGHISEKGKQS